MKNKEKPQKKSIDRKIRSAFFCWALLPVCVLTLIASSVAWFSRPKMETNFNASIVKSYFDADSVIKVGADGNLSECVFIITKPVHLYNLAYLMDKGIFTDRTTFQLGKPKLREATFTGSSDSSGTAAVPYYGYKSNSDNEYSDFNLTETVIDMGSYSSYGGIPPIGVSGANTEFCHTFAGNGITISNCTVTDSLSVAGTKVYFPHVGLFGTITDGTNVSNFNVLNLTVSASKENPGAGTEKSDASSQASDSAAVYGAGMVDIGLLIGYIDQTESKLDKDKIIFSSLGVANGILSAESTAYSAYSLVGNGTTKGLNTADGFFKKELASGNTGIVNFTEMVNSIRENKDETVKTRYRTKADDYNEDGTPKSETEADWHGELTKTYRIIDTYKKTNPFDEYILKDNDGNAVISVTGSDRGVNFRGNQIIAGTDKNGLGVFTVVTRAEDYDGDNWVNGLTQFVLRGAVYGAAAAYQYFYYSTAEYRDTEEVNYGKKLQDNWKPAFTEAPSGSISNDLYNNSYFYQMPFDATTGQYFTADYFLKRTAEGAENATAYKAFQDYLSDTLVYSGGAPIEATSKDFGITAKYEDLSTGEIKNVSEMRYFFRTQNYNSSGVGTVGDYVANSIYFTLNETANVTLYVSNRDIGAYTSYVGIYDDSKVKQHKDASGNISAAVIGNPTYAFCLPGTDYSFKRYMPDGTVQEDRVNGEYASGTRSALFAHTFKLEKGTYFVSVPDRTNSICAIEVQGQEGGNAGNIGSTGFSMDFIDENETDTLVGGEGYVWSRTAFVINKDVVGSLTVLFQRVKTYASTVIVTDVVYAYIKEGDATYVKPYGEQGVVETVVNG